MRVCFFVVGMKLTRWSGALSACHDNVPDRLISMTQTMRPGWPQARLDRHEIPFAIATTGTQSPAKICKPSSRESLLEGGSELKAPRELSMRLPVR